MNSFFDPRPLCSLIIVDLPPVVLSTEMQSGSTHDTLSSFIHVQRATLHFNFNDDESSWEEGGRIMIEKNQKTRT